jgi:hypothetical protein
LDLANLAPRVPDDSFLAWLPAKGLPHERAYLAVLRSQGRELVHLAAARSGRDRFGRTREAMRAGWMSFARALCGERWQRLQ